MSLRHAVLASLLDGEASGYELGKRMDVSVANFWRASRQQIYAELTRLHEEGLAEARDEAQTGRPNKRLYAITDAGEAELREFTKQPTRPYAIKDELLIKIQSADVGDIPAVIGALRARRGESVTRLAIYEELVRTYLNKRSEAEYLRTARRIGPYMNLRRGLDFERENLAWLDWAIVTLQSRDAERA